MNQPEIKSPSDSGYTLITGMSGFIATALALRLADERQIIGISRNPPKNNLPFVIGDFGAVDDLLKLDDYEITSVVHLAAVTGGSLEEDALKVNVLGTSRLLRYAIDRGCRKFVLASSIAAVGCLSAEFLPLQLPIKSDHPCLASDAYGLSKAMVEELSRYFQRGSTDCDFINLRYGAVDQPGNSTPIYGLENPPHLPFVELAHVRLDDVLEATTAALNTPHKAGVRVFNVVGPDSNTNVPVASVLRQALGERAVGLDLTWYDMPEHRHASLFSVTEIQEELGFVPSHTTRSN